MDKKLLWKLPKALPAGNSRLSYPFFENEIEGNDGIDPSDAEVWLKTEEAAKYLNLSVGSLRNMTSNGLVPHYKLGRRVRYLKSELRALLTANKRGAQNGN